MPNLPFSLYLVKDGAKSQLAAEIAANATSLTVLSGEGVRFPASDFCVRVGSETIYVGTRSGDVCNTLTRGYLGTTPATHPASSPVFQGADAALIQRLYDNLSQHTHNKADIPDFGHTHAQGDITNLVTNLAAKEATANKNAANGYAGLDGSSKLTGSQQVYGTGANTACVGNDARLSDARTPTTHSITSAHNGFPGGTSTFLRADGSFAAPSGGSDPWTYVILGSDFPTTSATAVDVTGLAFTPLANTRYEVQGLFLLRTATATVGPRPGCAWPTGLTDGVATIETTSSAQALVFQNGNISAAVLAPVGGLPTTTGSWPGKIHATFLAGASPSGTFKIQLASETAGTTVTMKASSWLRYRSVA